MREARNPEGRWAWVEINLGAIRRNTKALKRFLPAGVKLMCAVKANAYGHGAVECAHAMHLAGADQFAVATVAEGVELREGGIEQPILMLNESPRESVATLLSYDIMPTIYSSDFAFAYGEQAVSMGKVGRYHLAIDTGMTRIGVLPEDVVEFRRLIDFHRGLECAGTYTHFATADTVQGWDFSLQLQRFRDAVDALRGSGFEVGLVHCDNTPGIILHPEAHFDMCRAGIGLYGLHPADTTVPRVELEPAMSVRARVMRVVEPPVGEGVSYGLEYRIPRGGMQVATVPLGYADGLSRLLSGQMDVIVGGSRARQVGCICMDQCMFVVDPIARKPYRPARPVEVGDVVTILGRDGDEEIRADELASILGTINYEVVCDLGNLRLEHVYV